jgi:acyl-CoA thioesterase-2
VPQDAVDDLVELLDLEPIEVNIFRGVSPDEDHQRIFGGQVAGQALVAAARTVEPGRRVHSLHAYFLRAGDPKLPVLYEVDRIRDGRSFTTRRVVAIQHGKAIFNMSASFQIEETGFEHAFEMPDVTPPEDLPTVRERAEAYEGQVRAWIDRPRPIDMPLHGEPRSRDVVPPHLPGRRLAALRAGQPQRHQRARPGPRARVHPSGHARGHGDAGGPDPHGPVTGPRADRRVACGP